MVLISFHIFPGLLLYLCNNGLASMANTAGSADWVGHLWSKRFVREHISPELHVHTSPSDLSLQRVSQYVASATKQASGWQIREGAPPSLEVKPLRLSAKSC